MIDWVFVENMFPSSPVGGAASTITEGDEKTDALLLIPAPQSPTWLMVNTGRVATLVFVSVNCTFTPTQTNPTPPSETQLNFHCGPRATLKKPCANAKLFFFSFLPLTVIHGFNFANCPQRESQFYSGAAAPAATHPGPSCVSSPNFLTLPSIHLIFRFPGPCWPLTAAHILRALSLSLQGDNKKKVANKTKPEHFQK